MKQRKSPLIAMMLALMMTIGLLAIPVSAQEYDFSSGKPGQNFYQSTEGDYSSVAANSGTIVVGVDGTIGTDTSAVPSMSPLSKMVVPVGEYPNSWGVSTDIAIAQNSVMPNAFAPPTPWSDMPGWSAYDMWKVTSGAIPTGAELGFGYLIYGLGYFG